MKPRRSERPSPAGDPEASKSAGRGRWSIAALLGVGVLINYFDRVNLSVSHESLRGAFGVSDIVFGYLLGAYNVSYALCQLPSGALLDRFGVRPVTRVGTLLWSAASFAAAGAWSVSSLFGARLLLGVGEAPFFPANAKAIGRWFPADQRSLATSFFDGAAKLASAIGVPVLGVLVLTIGWRLSFAATGIASLAYFLLFSLIYREPRDDESPTPRSRLAPQDAAALRSPSDLAPRGAPTNAARDAKMSLAALLKEPKVIGLTIGFGSYNYVFYLLLTWLPSYLSQQLHIDLLHSFLYTGVPWLVATATDIGIGGWMVDALIRRGCNANRVRMTVLVVGMLLGLGIFGAASARTSFQALAWITISIGGLAAAAPVAWSAPSLIAPRANVGMVGGIVNSSNQISGFLAPVVTGYIVAATRSFALAFDVAAAYLVLGVLAYLFLLRSISPFPLRKALSGG